MTTTRLDAQPVHDALTRVRDALVEAARGDARISRDDAERALARLPEPERRAADEFVAKLRDGRRNVVTVPEVDQVIAELRAGLPGVDDGARVSLLSAGAKRLGDELLLLARRLAGEPGAVLPPLDDSAFAGLEGDALLGALRERCAAHLALSYAVARAVMYTRVDNQDGVVRCVYTERDAPARAVEKNGFNAEHTLPRSLGARDLPAKSDLHHLFPTDSTANGKRSSFPFGHVVDVVWQDGSAKLGTDAAGTTVFEPPDVHKGNVARALFYMAAMYGIRLPDDEERALRAWHETDPVDARERARNDEISKLQGNRNPFVDDAGLVDRIEDY